VVSGDQREPEKQKPVPTRKREGGSLEFTMSQDHEKTIQEEKVPYTTLGLRYSLSGFWSIVYFSEIPTLLNVIVSISPVGIAQECLYSSMKYLVGRRTFGTAFFFSCRY
jgi:hypothetical protein